MSENTEKKKVKGHECKFATYVQPPEEGAPDLHFVKVMTHYEDGTMEPAVQAIYDFKRPFWVTKKDQQRSHTQKKETEELKKVDKFVSTQSQLARNVAKALGTPWARPDLRTLSRSPYLYGSDILSTAVIKKAYQDKYPDVVSSYRVAVYDIETDVVEGTKQIIMASITMGKRVFTAVQKSFVKGWSDAEARAREAFQKYLSDMEGVDKDDNPIRRNIIEERGLEWELEFVDREIDVVRRVFETAHVWMPDFIAIWNIDFDISCTINACKAAGVDPKDIFSDPDVPEPYRYFHYKKGKDNQTSNAGVYKSLSWYEQWHTIFCPASFYFVDAGAVYYRQRSQKGKDPSYALDAILTKELGLRKLKFKEAEGMSEIDWHAFMQERYPFEYIVYNVFDCISMELLDEQTTDLQLAMPGSCGFSDFANYKSQPRRLVDKLHYFVMTKGYVFGSTSDQMADEIDNHTLGVDDWIVMLPAHLVADNGLRIIEEDSGWRTNICVHVADLDVTASYPNGGAVFNVSKRTCRRELCKIEGVPEIQQRMQGINFVTSGHTNAVEVCTALFGMPTLEAMSEAFGRHLAQQEAMTVEMAA